MLARRYLAIGIVVFAVAVERAGFYLFRSEMTRFLQAMFVETGSDIGRLFSLFSWLMLVGTLAGGALGLVVGPRVTALVGFATSLFAILLIAVIHGYEIFILLYAFGVGIVKPTSYAYAADGIAREDDDAELLAPSPRRFFTLGAVVCALLAMTDAGAAYGPEWGQRLGQTLGSSGILIGVFGLTILAAAGFLVTLWVDPAKPAAPPAKPMSSTASNGLVVAALFAVASTVFACTTSTSWQDAMDADFYGWTSVLETVSAFAFFGVFVSLAGRRAAAPLATYYGIGLAGAGVFMFFAALQVGGTAYYCGVAEALFEPLAALGVVFAAVAARGKMTTFVVAAFLGAEAMGNVELRALHPSSPRLLAGAGALMLIGAAIAVIINARKIHGAYEVLPRATR